MPGTRNDSKFWISPSACVTFAMMLLLLPIRWILAAAVAAMFHEFCHIAAVLLCGGNFYGLRVGSNGAILTAEEMSSGRTLLCTIAGPLGSLFLLLFVRWFPRIAFCGAVQGMYNLLPIYPLDGGRAIRCFLQMWFPQYVDNLFMIIQKFSLLTIGLLAIYVSIFRRLGMIPLVFFLALWLRSKKDLANAMGSGYNIGDIDKGVRL